jgi:hypothetical protein
LIGTQGVKWSNTLQIGQDRGLFDVNKVVKHHEGEAICGISFNPGRLVREAYRKRGYRDKVN